MSVLILASLYDFSVDLVCLRLEEMSVPFVRLNREQLADHRLSLNPVTPRLSIRGPAGDITIGSDLAAIWFRQPVFLRNTPPYPLETDEQLQRSQWMAFLRALCVFRHASWMNHPATTYLAESKPYQLAIAAESGFAVPSTIATNDADRIRSSFPTNLVVKSLDTVLLRDGDDCLFTYTTIDPIHSLSDESVSAAPLLAQEALRDKIDMRVTIVGEDIFAVRILAGDRGIAGDWRLIPKSQLDYQDFQPSTELMGCCRRLVQHLGLAFAAIDLIETPDGVFFIEVNPTGEWAWLTNAARPIDTAIARWLGGPPRTL